MTISDTRGCIRAQSSNQQYPNNWFWCLTSKFNLIYMPGSQSTTSEQRLGANCTVTKWQCVGVWFPGSSGGGRNAVQIGHAKSLLSCFKPFAWSGPGPTQIPKHREEYKLARVSAFIIWLSCFDLKVLVLPRLEKMSPFSSRLDVKVHPGFQTSAPNALT